MSSDFALLTERICELNKRNGFSYLSVNVAHHAAHRAVVYIALAHTELSEATEALRSTCAAEALERVVLALARGRDRPTDADMAALQPFAEELADTVIRVLHLAGMCGIDIGAEVDRKMDVNATRPYRHGKAF